MASALFAGASQIGIWTTASFLLRPLAVLATGNMSSALTASAAIFAPRRLSKAAPTSVRRLAAQSLNAAVQTVDLQDDDPEHHHHPEAIKTRFPRRDGFAVEDAARPYVVVPEPEEESLPNTSEDYHDPYPHIKEELGFVHSTESFSAVDGPGMRFLVFLQGCAFRCLFCSNPDTWAMHTGDRVSSKVIGNKIDHVLPYLKSSGGGVTCSGGEAMLQPHFVAAVFEEAHARGLNTCLDTTGQGTKHHHWDIVLPHTDLVLFCVKQMNPQKYVELVGHQQGNMLHFAEELKARGIKTWCRYVLVPGLTDDAEDIDLLAGFVSKHDNMLGVELLPYHRLGVDKWSVMGLKYPLDGYKTPSKAQTQSVIHKLEAAGVKVLCDVPSH